MSERVELIIDGLPFPQPRARARGMMIKGRLTARVYNPTDTDVDAWKVRVKAAWLKKRGLGPPWTGPVVLSATLYLPRPAKFDAAKYSIGAIPCTNPQLGDFDNLGKSITDALTDAGAWKHDGLIYDGRVVKYHHAIGGSTGARIVLVHEPQGDSDAPLLRP